MLLLPAEDLATTIASRPLVTLSIPDARSAFNAASSTGVRRAPSMMLKPTRGPT
ncbi:MAG: hypothetical protein V4574_08490 [Pseudomonadota bacterium]